MSGKEWSKMPIIRELNVSCTVIAISKDRLTLIVQRPPNKSFPLKWTVAGGKIKVGDGKRISDTFYYHPAEYCACREFYEETGIPISSSGLYYLDSIYSADTDRLILSFYVIINENAKNIPIKLDECQDYKWISEDQIKDFDFIPDIGGEIKEVFKRLPRR